MNSFDIDGVIYLGPGRTGVRPYPGDVIITGRSFEEREETERMLLDMGITNKIYYNPLPFDKKTRRTSGEHKARVIKLLGIDLHFEDDMVQVNVIKDMLPGQKVVWLSHDLVELENVRQIWP